MQKVGFKFQTFYGENNINNRPFNEIRAVVDDILYVVYSETKGGKSGYDIMYKDSFDWKMKDGCIIPIQEVRKKRKRSRPSGPTDVPVRRM